MVDYPVPVPTVSSNLTVFSHLDCRVFPNFDWVVPTESISRGLLEVLPTTEIDALDRRSRPVPDPSDHQYRVVALVAPSRLLPRFVARVFGRNMYHQQRI